MEVVVDILCSSIYEYLVGDLGQSLHKIVRWFELRTDHRDGIHITHRGVKNNLRVKGCPTCKTVRIYSKSFTTSYYSAINEARIGQLVKKAF